MERKITIPEYLLRSMINYSLMAFWLLVIWLCDVYTYTKLEIQMQICDFKILWSDIKLLRIRLKKKYINWKLKRLTGED